MAFVINKSELQSVFYTKNDNPGPGSYLSQENTVQERPAPFNSSSYKKSCFEIGQTNVGPGSYEKTNKALQPSNKSACISSFKSKVQRVDFAKLNNQNTQCQNHYQQQKSLVLCRNPIKRFKTQQSREDKLKQKKDNLNKLRKQNNSRKINSIVQGDKQMVRIILSNPKNTENIESFVINTKINIRQGNGPGQYNFNTTFIEKNKSVIDWSKDKEKRFKRSKSCQNTYPGPGQYELMNQTEKSKTYNRESSSFSYAGVRSYMDTVIYKTNNNMKAKILECKKIKDKSPGPADYFPDRIQSDSFYYGKQLIGSSAERFKIQKSKISIPGPGHYTNVESKYKFKGLIKQVRDKIFRKNNSLVSHCNDPDFISLQKQLQAAAVQESKSENELIFCKLKERCQSKAGSLSRQARFKQNTKLKGPGPGQYSSLSTFQNKSVQQNGIFKSNIQRKPYEAKNIKQQLPFYEIGISDIGYQAEKKRQNIQSLKKVAIEKPPFDSNVSRFLQNSRMTHGSQNKKDPHLFSYQRDQIDYDSFKPYKEKTCYASVFRSTTDRQPYIMKNNPGPGSYQHAVDSLNKKSFNSQYARMNRQKALSTSKLQST